MAKEKVMPKKKSKSMNPLRVGNKVFIRAVTMYYTGQVEEITGDEIVLSAAAWVASTGRFNNALSTGILDEVEPFPEPVCVGRGAIIDVTNWPHELPKAVK